MHLFLHKVVLKRIRWHSGKIDRLCTDIDADGFGLRVFFNPVQAELHTDVAMLMSAEDRLEAKALCLFMMQ